VTTEAKVEAVALSIKPAVFYVRVSDDPARISASTGFPSYSCVAVVTLAEHEQIVARHASAITALEGEVSRLRAIEEAARTYYREYCQDEAGDELLNDGRGMWTGATAKQISDAAALRDALTKETP
jgi:hypothetical protein